MKFKEDNHNKIILSGYVVYCVLTVLIVGFFAIQAMKADHYSFDLSQFKVTGGTYHSDSNSIEGTAENEYFAEAPIYTLPRGDYILHIQYASDVEGDVLVRASNDCVFSVPLPASDGSVAYAESAFSLVGGTDKGKMDFAAMAEGHMELYEVTLSCNHMIYTDYVFYIMLVLILGILVSVGYFRYQSGKWKPVKEQFIYAAVFILTVLCSSGFFIEKGLTFSVDTRAQLLRIEGIRAGLFEGQFPVIINPNYCNQYGELGALYPGVLIYFAAVLRYFGVSMMTAYKALMILIDLGVAGIMYITAKSVLRSPKWAMTAAVIYSFEAYRLHNVTGGGGTGTGAALVFLPLVIVGIYHIVMDDRKKWYWLGIGMFGMFSSHLLTTIFAVIFLVLFCIVNIKRCINKEVIFACLKAMGLFLALGAGFILPFLRYYFTDWNKTALQWSDFYGTVFSASQIPMVAYSILTLCFVVLAGIMLFIMYRKGEKPTVFCLQLYISIACMYVMTMALFPWRLLGRIGAVDELLKMIQFSDRVLALASPMIALLAAWILSMNKSKNLQRACVILTGAMVLYSAIFGYNYYVQKDILLWDEVTGDINSKAQEDYLPAGTLSEYYATDSGNISDYDAVQSLLYQKTGTHITYQYICANEGEYIEAPLFYYDGYEAYDEDGNGLRTEIGTQNRVRVYLEKSLEPKTIYIQFKVSLIYTFAGIFSILFGIGFAVYQFKYKE